VTDDVRAGEGEAPLRVSTLELFFDLVFVFAITQLTGILSHDVSVASGFRVLLVFGALWWMYGGYVWLANARTPSRTAERLLMLVGMAGFLIMALAIPDAFYRDGVALGIGYLIVVLVHAWLYQRVNRNIARVVPFNLAAALLVIVAGVVKGPAGYVLWAVALALPVLSPLVVHPRGRFSIQPSHFTERHGALVIIVLGESVVDIGIGAEGHPVTVSLALSAVLGLALTAALWWAYFGAEDDERAERAMVAADPALRPALALAAYFYAYIPMLLGIVALASGVKQAIVNTGSTLPAGPCVAMGCGVALFLAGSAAFRHALRIGPGRYRLTAAVVALAASAVGVTLSVAAEIALLILIVVAALVTERQDPRRGSPGGSGGTGSPPRSRGGLGGIVPPGQHCVYKPIAGERPLWDFPMGTLAGREVAAYVVSRAAGWDVVPPTVMRDGPFGPGMCQLWIDHDTDIDLIALSRRTDHAGLRDMAVFDAVVNNADRKIGHLLPVADGHLYGCDHGVCFAEDYKLRTVLWQWRGKTLPRRSLEALRRLNAQLNDGGLEAELSSLLSADEIAATKIRVETLLKHRVHPYPPADWPAVPWPPV
jgi:uncharacterized repeat protein (TIGR03843 family)